MHGKYLGETALISAIYLEIYTHKKTQYDWWIERWTDI